MSELIEKQNSDKSKKVSELMEMSKALYEMHGKLGSFEGTTTSIRQDILKVCSGLDALRNQIVGETSGPQPEK